MTNLGELELLLHVWHRGLALQAGEGASHELRVDWVRAHHLPADAEQAADLCRGELTNPVCGRESGGKEEDGVKLYMCGRGEGRQEGW